MKPKIVTIGAYGANEETFFQALTDAQVDTFCDLRRRRGVRGREYAFANSRRLQEVLERLEIRYLHIEELAPEPDIIARQHEIDRRSGEGQRARKRLSQEFVEAYRRKPLAQFDARRFVEQLGPNARVVALFCAEREPEACHRSLVAERLHKDLGLPLEHLCP